MATTDPIADMLTRIRNAHHALHGEVSMPHSRLKEALAGILKDEGYIAEYSVSARDISMTLRYVNGKPVISGLKKISKPGRRVYVAAEDIPRVQNGLGICVLSTSHGVLAGQSAKDKNVGGEILCEIW